jgi:DNA polymerase-3 subunit delta'
MTQTVSSVSESVLKRFSALLKNASLAHAYLFIGPASVGKFETALAIAKLVNCAKLVSDSFCDICPSCIKIDKGNHPDIHIIERGEEETSIKIEQIRELTSGIQLKPFEARTKIFIIKNVESLTAEASNALLKTLEEPSQNSLLILTSAFPQNILDTVKSRCHQVQFFPLTQDKLEAELIKGYDVDKKTAHFLAGYAEGAFGKALQLNDSKLYQRKNEAIDQFVLLPGAEPFIQTIVADKERTKEVLSVLYSWFRDLLLVKSGVGEINFINIDRAGDLKRLEGKYSFEELQEALAEIVKTSKLLEDNLNLKIALSLMKEKLWRK